MVTRMQPRTVKVFCTAQAHEVEDATGRDYEGQ